MNSRIVTGKASTHGSVDNIEIEDDLKINVTNDEYHDKKNKKRIKHQKKGEFAGGDETLSTSTGCSSDSDVVSHPSTSKETSETTQSTAEISDYRVSKASQKVLKQRSITTFFPIQQKTYDAIYDGKHVIGRARTGTGKTLAFALPTIESLIASKSFSLNVCHVLVLLPTRELAVQVANEFIELECQRYGTTAIVGGLPEEPQLKSLESKSQVVVGTPGRILDFLRRDFLNVSQLKVFVLDEADQMLEMGFREDVDAILEHITTSINLKKKKSNTSPLQVLLFTATLPSWITSISSKYMSQGEKVVVDVVKGNQVQTATGISHLAIMCGFHQRSTILESLLTLYCSPDGRAIIFTETKALANQIAMNSSISSRCQVLHGDIQQQQRDTTLAAFKSGVFNCLVATDVAARGIHVDNVSLVIHIEPPKDVDTFVHRSGRTGRAGNVGTNIVLFRSMDTPFLVTIEKVTGIKFKRVGVPQPKDLLKAVSLSIAEKTVSAADGINMLNATKEAAELLIAELGPTEAVSRLLCELSGCNSKKNESAISVLTGREDQQTYEILFTKNKINTKAYVWNALKNLLGEAVTVKLGPMFLREDSTGAVFDVPKEFFEEVDKVITTRSKSRNPNVFFTMSTITELPAIYDPQFDSNLVSATTSDQRNPNSKNKRFRDSRNQQGYNNKDYRQPYAKQQKTQHMKRF